MRSVSGRSGHKPRKHGRNLRFREVGDPPEATQAPVLEQTPRHGTWTNICARDEAAPLEKTPVSTPRGCGPLRVGRPGRLPHGMSSMRRQETWDHSSTKTSKAWRSLAKGRCQHQGQCRGPRDKGGRGPQPQRHPAGDGQGVGALSAEMPADLEEDFTAVHQPMFLEICEFQNFFRLRNRNIVSVS